MPITISSVAIYDEFTGVGGGGVDFLIGSIGDKVVIDLTFDVFWSTENCDMVFDAATKTITRQDKTVYFPPIVYSSDRRASRPIASFLTDGFKVGDTITVDNTVSNDGVFTIAAVTDLVITTAEVIVDEVAPNTNIYGDTPVVGCDYYFNFIENDAQLDFKSAVDNLNTNKYNCPTMAIPMAATPMDAIGRSRGWEMGSAVINDVSLTSHHQIFKITHTVFITPFFIKQWQDNLINATNPDGFYKDSDSLKYAYKIDCRFTNRVAAANHTTGEDLSFHDGNVGFYNEFLNGSSPNYTLKSITFTDVVTGDTVDGLQYGRTTDVDIRLTSVNSVVAVGCKVVLNQLYCPQDTTDYIDTVTDMQDNFRYDRVLLTEGAAAASGEEVATSNKSITLAEANRIAANELQILYRCDLAADYSTMLAGKDEDNRNYLIFATPQDKAVTTTIDTDRNAVICDYGVYTTDNTDSTLFDIIGGDIFFHEYPNEVANEFTNYEGWSGDMVLAHGQFEVKALDDVQLKTLIFKIEAVQRGFDNIVLEEFNCNVDSFLPDADLIQQIEILEETRFQCAADSIYAYIEVNRLPAEDQGDYVAYDFRYPFKLRWESWVELISKYYRKGTQDWSTYQIDGWSIYFNIYASCYDVATTNTTDFLHTAYLDVVSFDERAVIPCVCDITTWDEAETMDLQGIIMTDENTVIKAQFQGDFSALPADTTGYYGVISIDSPEIGGVFYNQYSSTEEDVLTDGIWLGYVGNRAELTKISNTVIEVKALLDYTKINDLSEGKYPINYVMFSAKLGYLNEPDYLLAEDGTYLLQENNQAIALNP